jgi:hypothetical protein
MSSGDKEELGQEPNNNIIQSDAKKIVSSYPPPNQFTRLDSLTGEVDGLNQQKNNLEDAKQDVSFQNVDGLNQQKIKIQKRYEKYNRHFLNIQNAMKDIEHELDELHKEIDGILPEQKDFHEPSVNDDSQVDTSDLDSATSDLDSATSDLDSANSDSDSDTSDSDTDTSDSDSESPYTKKYSSKLQYPTIELALKVEDYIESNPDIRDFTLVYCCYSINTDYMIPFVIYSGKEADGKYQFPSISVTVTEDIDINSYKNTIKDGMFTGYIPDATNPSIIYMFFNVLTPKLLSGKDATINELCHLKSVDGINIDETVDKLFTQNGDLLYIAELETSEHIPVPFSGYLCRMDDENRITNVVKEEEEDDIQIFTTDIFNVGLQDDFYYLTTKSLNPDAFRYVIFPLKAVNFDKSILDYSEYNSVYYKTAELDFWAITSIKQIGKI